jgi:hypothetical protein
MEMQKRGEMLAVDFSSNPSGIFPTGVTGVELDVSKEEDWKRVAADIGAAHNRVDIREQRRHGRL